MRILTPSCQQGSLRQRSVVELGFCISVQLFLTFHATPLAVAIVTIRHLIKRTLQIAHAADGFLLMALEFVWHPGLSIARINPAEGR